MNRLKTARGLKEHVLASHMFLLRYERKDRFHRLAIEGFIELSYLSVVFYHHIYT